MSEFNNQYATKKLREESATSAGPGSANMTAGTGEQYATTKAFKKTKKNEIIKKVGDKYAVYPEKGGKRLGTHDSKEKAKKQLAAIEISKAQKESKDVEPKLAAGEAENYVKDKWGWKEAPSIPNRPSKGGFQYKQIFENMRMSDVELDYPEFTPIIEKVADYLGIDIQEFQAAQYRVEDEYLEIFLPRSKKTVMINVLPDGKLKVNTSSPVGSMQAVIEESYFNIPQNIVNFAKKKGISAELNMIANWVEKAGKRIVGGTAIGKNYNTLILDLTHQGSEIYYNIDNGSLEVNGQPVDSYEEFLEALTVVDGSLNESYSRFKKETKTRTNEQQLHAAMRLAERKIREANRILEYTGQLRGELNETRVNKNTQKLMEKITRGIAEAYGKMKKLK